MKLIRQLTLFLIIYFIASIRSVRIENKPPISNIIKDDFGELETLFNKIKSIDSKNTIRFKDVDINQITPDINKILKDNKNDLFNDVNNISYNVSDMFSYHLNENKDMELERQKGLYNCQIIYDGKLTVNTETNEFIDLYYEFQKSLN